MSVVFVVVPILVAGWPAIAAAVASACSALGYGAAKCSEALQEQEKAQVTAPVGPVNRSIAMEMANAEVIGEAMAREQVLQFTKTGVTATFRKDARGHLTLHVSGERSEEELAAEGKQLLNRVRQQFAYEKVKQDLQDRGFVVVEEQTEANESIRISVRRYQ
jgi:hypothetical protein